MFFISNTYVFLFCSLKTMRQRVSIHRFCEMLRNGAGRLLFLIYICSVEKCNEKKTVFCKSG